MAEGYKDWSAGEILTAADLEDYTVKQSVMRFADASARTTALSGVLAEGMMSYLKDTDTVEVYDGSAWAAVAGGKILQVVSTNKNDVFTTSSTSYVDVTGLSVTITPSSATSKILVLSNISTTGDIGTSSVLVQLVRNSTPLSVGSSSPSASDVGANVGTTNSVAMSYLDSPSTTSATTYKWQVRCVAGTVAINQIETGTIFTASNIVVLEVSA